MKPSEREIENRLRAAVRKDYSLFINSYWRNLLPGVSSRVGMHLMGIIDGIFASRYIGSNAVAAITLCAPFILFEDVIHDLLVAGTLSVVTRYKSRGENSKAARAFGAIFGNQFFWNVLIHILLFVFGNALIHLFTRDEQLAADALQYYYPFILTYPVIESGLCLERGFRTDGRASFFALRGILGNILNLVFNMLVIFAFDGGIAGLSIASILAAFLSYVWSCSHFFSSRCTIRPELSVFKEPGEAKGYLREELEIGSVFALDDGLYTLAAAAANRCLSYWGSTGVITVYGVATAAAGFYSAICNAVQGVYFQFTELFYSDRNCGALKKVHSMTLRLELALGTLFCVLTYLLSDVIADLYRIESAEAVSLFPFMMLMTGLCAVILCLSNIFSSFFIAARQNKTAAGINAVSNISDIAAMLAGCLCAGYRGLFFGKLAVRVSVLVWEAVRAGKSKAMAEKTDPGELCVLSYMLTEESITESSRKVYDFFVRNGNSSKAAAASAVVEESGLMTLEKNRKTGRKVTVSIRLLYDEKGFCITAMDNGEIFDPYARLFEDTDKEQAELSQRILKGFSPDGKYSRVLDLNISHLYLKNT